MERRFHRGFTAAEKTELWDRWKRGESLKAIGRAFGKQSSERISAAQVPPIPVSVCLYCSRLVKAHCDLDPSVALARSSTNMGIIADVAIFPVRRSGRHSRCADARRENADRAINIAGGGVCARIGVHCDVPRGYMARASRRGIRLHYGHEDERADANYEASAHRAFGAGCASTTTVEVYGSVAHDSVPSFNCF
jgi:hypothetical protein